MSSAKYNNKSDLQAMSVLSYLQGWKNTGSPPRYTPIESYSFARSAFTLYSGAIRSLAHCLLLR